MGLFTFTSDFIFKCAVRKLARLEISVRFLLINIELSEDTFLSGMFLR